MVEERGDPLPNLISNLSAGSRFAYGARAGASCSRGRQIVMYQTRGPENKLVHVLVPDGTSTAQYRYRTIYSNLEYMSRVPTCTP